MEKMHRCKAKSSPPCLRSQHTASARIDILKSGLKFPQIVIVVMLFYCQWKNMVCYFMWIDLHFFRKTLVMYIIFADGQSHFAEPSLLFK